jgi:hypothetical protein
VAATGVILAALYLLWAYQRVFHGEPDDDNKSFPELRGRRPRCCCPSSPHRVHRRVPEADAEPIASVNKLPSTSSS